MPFFFSDDHDRAAFQTWLKAYRPDCLILSAMHAYRWLSVLKHPPPVVMRTLENLQDREGPSGIRQDYTRLGRVAVEQLLAQVQHNQMGIPDQPIQILLVGTWEDIRTKRSEMRAGR